MKKAINILFTCGILACVPLVAQADDLKIVNHTKVSATAMAFNKAGAITNNTCSSTLGESGIITPDYNDSKPYVIPSYAVTMACNPTCVVSVFIDKACKANKIATGELSIKNGITSISNLPNAGGYYIKQTGKNSISIENTAGSKASSIFDVMFKKLGL